MRSKAGKTGTGAQMLDAAQKRAALIEHLVSASSLADELGDGTLGFLIERAIDQARARQVSAITAPKIGHHK
jgi:hypothetical protein